MPLVFVTCMYLETGLVSAWPFVLLRFHTFPHFQHAVVSFFLPWPFMHGVWSRRPAESPSSAQSKGSTGTQMARGSTSCWHTWAHDMPQRDCCVPRRDALNVTHYPGVIRVNWCSNSAIVWRRSRTAALLSVGIHWSDKANVANEQSKLVASGLVCLKHCQLKIFLTTECKTFFTINLHFPYKQNSRYINLYIHSEY